MSYITRDVFIVLKQGSIRKIFDKESKAEKYCSIINKDEDHPDDKAHVDQWDVEFEVGDNHVS